MKRSLRMLLAWIALTLTARCLHAEPPAAKNYFLAPIKTDLQRSLISRANVYAQFDVAETVRDETFDPRRFDHDEIRKDLAALAEQSGVPRPSLQIYFRYANVVLDKNETKTMEDTVTKICRQAGFANIRTGGAYEGGSWKDKLAKVAGVDDESGATEPPVEDEFVRAYPVRTRLSRFVLGDPTTDCFVELRQPIDGRFQGFTPAAKESIGKQIAQLELPRKRKLVFRILATTAGQAVAERYFALPEGKPPHVSALIRELGFESSAYMMTPMRVSPEDMLGKPAPDFTLDTLAGDKFHLRDKTRGRVAVIAFWGVACGACRIEAPYLTALQERYAEQGLVVIGVNGYDESKEVVDEYVRRAGLKHEIALMGGKVAQEKYTVASYPITFLVDKSGAIVDYHLGFDAGDEKLLAATIARPLAEPAGAKDPK